MHRVEGPGFLLWDVISCPFPTKESEVRATFRNILSAVSARSPLSGFPGITSLMAIGSNNPPRIILDNFSWIVLIFSTPKIHVRKMIRQLRSWAKNFPAPANFFVISGDNELSSTLKILHNRSYDILVAHPDGKQSTHLAETASCVWTYSSLIGGKPPYHYRKEMVPRLFIYPQPKVSTLVLWDLRTCSLPTDIIKCRDTIDNVYSSVLANCSCTQISMMAVGVDDGIPNRDILDADMLLKYTSPETQLSSMIYCMEDWAMHNPVPANFLVISGDTALSPTLEKLQSRNYNILVAHSGMQSTDLVATASHAWKFESLVRGEAPYFVRRVEEPSKLEPAAVVRPKKKSKYQRSKEGLRELEMNHEEV